MSKPPPFFRKICYVKVCVLKNWKQLFLSKLILYLLGQEYEIYFSFLTHIFTRYLQNFHEKKFWTHETPTRKNYGPTKARWHDDSRSMRATMARDSQNVAHSKLFKFRSFGWVFYLVYSFS